MTDYQPSLDDTQPRPPVQVDDTQPQRPIVTPPPPDEPPHEGPGCLLWGCISLFGMVFAVVIVIMAGAAGWTAGQREASSIATATQSAAIADQLNRIPQELERGSLELANTRLRWLAQLTPGVESVPQLVATATAVYIQRQPTATPTPSPTLEATPTPDASADLPLTPVEEGSGYDLAALLAEARTDIESGQFAEAYELLDVITALDPAYEAQTVRDLTTTALNGQARALFNANRPAEAIIWASIAEDLGVLQGDNSFELFAAQRYLDATAAIGLSYPQAIGALQDIVGLGPGRYYEQSRQLLFQQYVGYADAYVAEGNHCAAVPQYQNALTIFNDASVSSKRDNAQQTCEQGTPIPAEGVTPGTPGQAVTPSGGVAPVGQGG